MFPRVVALVTEREAGVTGLIPVHLLLLAERALQFLQQLVRAPTRPATLQINRTHGHAQSVPPGERARLAVRRANG